MNINLEKALEAKMCREGVLDFARRYGFSPDDSVPVEFLKKIAEDRSDHQWGMVKLLLFRLHLLSEADLSGADLRYSNLSGADLRDSNLSGAGLRYSNLSGADLRGTTCSCGRRQSD